jgi:hypothetical protein
MSRLLLSWTRSPEQRHPCTHSIASSVLEPVNFHIHPLAVVRLAKSRSISGSPLPRVLIPCFTARTPQRTIFAIRGRSRPLEVDIHAFINRGRHVDALFSANTATLCIIHSWSTVPTSLCVVLYFTAATHHSLMAILYLCSYFAVTAHNSLLIHFNYASSCSSYVPKLG